MVTQISPFASARGLKRNAPRNLKRTFEVDGQLEPGSCVDGSQNTGAASHVSSHLVHRHRRLDGNASSENTKTRMN